MANNPSDQGGSRPARPAIPPFRGPGAAPRQPAARPSGVPGERPAAPPFAPQTPARPAAPVRATPPFARPAVAARPATPAAPPSPVVPPTPSAPAVSAGAEADVPREPVDAAGWEAFAPSTPTLGTAAASDDPLAGLDVIEPAGSAFPPAAAQEWLTADTAVRGEFGELVDEMPHTDAPVPPALPTPPAPWPVVAGPAAEQEESAWPAGLGDEPSAVADAAEVSAAGESGETTGFDAFDAGPLAEPATDEPAADQWTAGYEAEAEALLGDVEPTTAQAPEEYLASEWPDGTPIPGVPLVGEGGRERGMDPSMLPTPVMGIPPVRSLAGPTDGTPLATHAVPPDPVLAAALHEDTWDAPLADEPLGGYDSPGASLYGSTHGATLEAGDAADMLERIAARVRSGALPVPASALSAGEAAVLAATLAALLGSDSNPR